MTVENKRELIELAAKAVGLFIVLQQEGGTVRLDFDEFVEITKAVGFLKKQAEGVESD